MNALKSRDNVFYPPVGIVHNISDIVDLVEPFLHNKTQMVINTSAQPNSHPHLGTITTMMTAFAVAKHFATKFVIPTKLIFDALENAPAEKRFVDGIEYQRSLDMVPGMAQVETMADEYLLSFRHLFNYLQKRTGIDYEIKFYRVFQAQMAFRYNLLRILNEIDRFAPILGPAEKRVRVRFPCPVCGFSDKQSRNVKIVEITNDYALMESACFEHGLHKINITSAGGGYVDTNTPLRSVLKQAVFAEDSKKGVLTVMVDGGDWAGTWASSIEILGASMLGYDPSELPIRFYAPVILDWSGAKFSKSMYLHSGAYAHIPNELIDYESFRKTYGEDGLDILWTEVQSWVSEPRKFFRNYSLDYMSLLLEPSVKE